ARLASRSLGHVARREHVPHGLRADTKSLGNGAYSLALLIESRRTGGVFRCELVSTNTCWVRWLVDFLEELADALTRDAKGSTDVFHRFAGSVGLSDFKMPCRRRLRRGSAWPAHAMCFDDPHDAVQRHLQGSRDFLSRLPC